MLRDFSGHSDEISALITNTGMLKCRCFCRQLTVRHRLTITQSLGFESRPARQEYFGQAQGLNFSSGVDAKFSGFIYLGSGVVASKAVPQAFAAREKFILPDCKIMGQWA